MGVYKECANGLMKTLPFTSLLLLATLSGCGGGGSGGGAGVGTTGPVDNTAPTVTSMSPDEDSRGVATNIKLTATFSEAMRPDYINPDNFRLTDGDAMITGTVSYDSVSNIATFTPASGLAPDKRYTATIVTGIKDRSNNPLTTDFAWCFVTGSGTDNSAPVMRSTVPDHQATGVATHGKLSITFNEALDTASLNPASFSLTGPGASVNPGRVVYRDKTAVFMPDYPLAANTAYIVTVSGVGDLAGNAVAGNIAWNFTTGSGADSTPPVVAWKAPEDNATGVPISQAITVGFNEPMDPTTLSTASFMLTDEANAPVIGNVTYDPANRTATFTRIKHLITPVDFHPTPVSNLEPATAYTVTLTTEIRDMAGNALAGGQVWRFTTAS